MIQVKPEVAPGPSSRSAAVASQLRVRATGYGFRFVSPEQHTGEGSPGKSLLSPPTPPLQIKPNVEGTNWRSLSTAFI